MKNEFPLQEFLQALNEQGIYVLPRDYQRIQLVLSTKDHWTLNEFRQILLALLVTDEEKEEIFLHTFHMFITEILEEKPSPDEEVTIDKSIPKPPPIQIKDKEQGKIITQKLLLPLIAIVIALFAFIIWNVMNVQVTKSPTEISPNSITFSFENPDTTQSSEISIKNSGADTVTIENIACSDSCFTIGSFPPKILPQDSITIPVTFSPDTLKSYTDTLLIVDNTPESPYQIPLSAYVKETIRDTIPREPIVREEPERLYKKIPYVEKIESVTPPKQNSWMIYAAVAGLLLIGVVYYINYLRNYTNPPKAKPLKYDPKKPTLFPMGKVGGDPDPYLDSKTLDILGDSLGYFLTEEYSRYIDVPASIKETLNNGGIPSPVFHKRKKVRNVIILEDAFAEAGYWNTTARELANGLFLRGIDVTYANFCGIPDKFRLDDGQVVHLEDLEDERNGYILLIFSDGNSLHNIDSDFVLERLSHWPHVAWMELRDEKFWDHNTQKPMADKYNIPVYPANKDGLMRAFGRFLTEQGALSDISGEVTDWKGFPAFSTQPQKEYIEDLLGDALLWAQECAMIQPISIGLADKLRTEFHELPNERFERLYKLPNTIQNRSGLCFSDEVLKILRCGFSISHTPEDQKSVFQFILDQLEQAKPTGDDAKDSIALLTWQWKYDRIRLELGKKQAEDAMKNIYTLAQPNSPLAKTVTEELNTTTEDLKTKSDDTGFKQRVAEITGEKIAGAYDVAKTQYATLIIFILCFIGVAGWSAQTYMKENAPPKTYTLSFTNADEVPATAVLKQGEELIDSTKVTPALTWNVQPDSSYQLILYDNGDSTTTSLSSISNNMNLALGWQQKEIDSAITGKVIDRETNLPIKNAMIKTDPETEKVLTDSVGTYTIEITDVGEYEVIANKEGYMPDSLTITITQENNIADFRLKPVKEDTIPIEPTTGSLIVSVYKDEEKLEDVNIELTNGDTLITAKSDEMVELEVGNWELTAFIPDYLKKEDNLFFISEDGGDRIALENTEEIKKDVLIEANQTKTIEIEILTPTEKLGNGFLTVTVKKDNQILSSVPIRLVGLTKDNQTITAKSDEKIELGSGTWNVRPTQTFEGYITPEKNIEIEAGKEHQLTLEYEKRNTPLRGAGGAIDWVFVEGDTFMMGCTEEQRDDCDDDEIPAHEVIVDDFYISKYEVTNEQYAKFLNEYGSDTVKEGEYKGQEMIYEYRWGVKKENGEWKPQEGYENHPVVYVTWYGANEFCNWLSEKTGSDVRLPTEAEWEYAAREGGKKVRFGNGEDIARASEINFDASADYKEPYSEVGEYRRKTVPVNSFSPNSLGLYNMSGNVWEWCSDWYDSDYYEKRVQDNPQGPESGGSKVVRGGSWPDNPYYLRASNRSYNTPAYKYNHIGFRVVISRTQ